MKLSTAKTEIMCLSRLPVQCSFQTNRVTLQQTKKFKYLGITFSSDAKQDNELDTRIGKANAVVTSDTTLFYFNYVWPLGVARQTFDLSVDYRKNVEKEKENKGKLRAANVGSY